jgi:hypothetical protein
MPNIPCEICHDAVDADNVQSTDEYEVICSPCMDEFWTCVDCSGQYNDDDYHDLSHGRVCQSCINDGDYGSCYCCEDIIQLSSGDHFYDGNYTGEYACSDCGDEELRECENCGSSIIWSECGSDNYDHGLCYDCHNRPTTSIEHYVGSRTISRSNVQTLKSYVPAADSTGYFANWFYDGNDYNHNNINVDILKGAKGIISADEEERPAWWDSKMSITSGVYRDTAVIIYRLINSNTFLTEHKKYGLYHPMRHLFRKCITYRDVSGDVLNGADLSLQAQGEDYFGYSIDYVDKRRIASALAENKTDDGADLRRAIHQIFSRAYKLRLPQWIAGLRDEVSQRHWNTTLQNYNTNASNLYLDISIGFENNFALFKEINRFNERCSSCQTANNRDSYAFGYMDMFTNPHLFAFIRNEEGAIIGRSVIRLFKADWALESEPVYVAPSRLYLTEHTQAKSDVYVGLFEAVNRWATETFTNHHMIAYRSSRHDTSIRSILSNHPNKVALELDTPLQLQTQAWLPYWRTRPRSGDSDFTYYRDEDQRVQFYNVEGSTNRAEDYAVKELLSTHSYAIVEIKTND